MGVKITVDIPEILAEEARRLAQSTGTSLDALVAEGLRRVLGVELTIAPYELPDRAVGEEDGSNPLVHYSWTDLRDEIYGDG